MAGRKPENVKKRVFSALVCALLLLGCIFAVSCGAHGGNQDEAQMRLYFVRHGQTDTNVAGLLVGTSGDPQLTDEGRTMALQLGEGLSEIPFSAVYASPLTRAEDKAALILQGAGKTTLEIKETEDLRDISWGDAEGLTSAELAERFGITSNDQAFGETGDESFVSPIHAETKWAFYQRFDRAISSIIEEQNRSGNILIVAHSSIDFWLQEKFPEEAGKGLDNCSVSVVEISETGEMELVEYNNTEYLNQ